MCRLERPEEAPRAIGSNVHTHNSGLSPYVTSPARHDRHETSPCQTQPAGSQAHALHPKPTTTSISTSKTTANTLRTTTATSVLHTHNHREHLDRHERPQHPT
ncbi:hypothetical protein IMZ48_44805 [Candidatus Bathyarchaeota archaeon]|nr:hypothetical protein [Candidatus Bathyarchaeota archaeon]